MMRVARCLAWMGLLLLVACEGPESCGVQALDQPLAEEQLGPRSLEFHVPEAEMEDLQHEILWLLGEEGQAAFPLEIPALSGSLGGPLDFDSQSLAGQVSLNSMESWLEEGQLRLQVTLEPHSLSVPLQVYSELDPLRVCQLQVTIPSRQALVLMRLADEGDDQPLHFAAEAAWDSGEAFSPELMLEEGCPQQEGSQLETIWREALSEAYRVGLGSLAEAMSGAADRSLGLDVSLSGKLADGLRFQLSPQLSEVSTDESAWSLGLRGGVSAGSHECVPDDLLSAPPADGQGAPFSEVLPRSGEAYGMAVAISKAFVQQGLTAAHRSGLFCRSAGEGALELELDDLLPSTTDFAPLGSVRVAVFPDGAPQLGVQGADLDAGETLFRLRVSLPQVSMDVYGQMDGAALRLLACKADLRLTLATSIENGLLRFQLVDLAVNNLEILFDELLSESGEDLRQRSTQVIQRVTEALLARLPAMGLNLPVCGAGAALEGQLSEEHLLLYFADPFEPGPWP